MHLCFKNKQQVKERFLSLSLQHGPRPGYQSDGLSSIWESLPQVREDKSWCFHPAGLAASILQVRPPTQEVALHPPHLQIKYMSLTLRHLPGCTAMPVPRMRVPHWGCSVWAAQTPSALLPLSLFSLCNPWTALTNRWGFQRSSMRGLHSRK